MCKSCKQPSGSCTNVRLQTGDSSTFADPLDPTGSSMTLPPFELEFIVTAGAPREQGVLGDTASAYDDNASLRINGEWYTWSDISRMHYTWRDASIYPWFFVTSENGFMAVLLYDAFSRRILCAEEGEIIYFLDIVDLISGKRYEVFTEPLIQHRDDLGLALRPHLDGFLVDTGADALYIFIDSMNAGEIVVINIE